MRELLKFLTTYEKGVYVILAVIAGFSIQRLVRAWWEKKKAYYGLEREATQTKIRSAFAILALAGLMALTEFMLVTVIGVRFPGLMELKTSTPNLVYTATIPMTLEGDMEVTPQGYELTQTSIAVTGCIPGQLEWISPKPDEEISGAVELKGTVNIANQGFYKYEYQQQGKEEWIPIAAGSKIVIEDSLGGKWNTEQLAPGLYYLRLVVSDNQNKLLRPCVILVRVVSS